jgi:hypothetical protein
MLRAAIIDTMRYSPCSQIIIIMVDPIVATANASYYYIIIFRANNAQEVMSLR